MFKKAVKKEVVKEEKKEEVKPVVAPVVKTEYDPNIPMNKQRHLR